MAVEFLGFPMHVDVFESSTEIAVLLIANCTLVLLHLTMEANMFFVFVPRHVVLMANFTGYKGVFRVNVNIEHFFVATFATMRANGVLLGMQEFYVAVQ